MSFTKDKNNSNYYAGNDDPTAYPSALEQLLEIHIKQLANEQEGIKARLGLTSSDSPNAPANGAFPTVADRLKDNSDVLADHENRITALENTPIGGGLDVGALLIWPVSSGYDVSKYMPAHGQAISRTTYADLFTLYGTTFGAGDGVNTFNLPNLSNESILFAGAGGNYSILAFLADGGSINVGAAITKKFGSQSLVYSYVPISGSAATNRRAALVAEAAFLNFSERVLWPRASVFLPLIRVLL